MPVPAHCALRSINALTLCTRDMRAACAFYSKLGLVVTFGGPEADFTTFSANAPVTPVCGGWRTPGQCIPAAFF